MRHQLITKRTLVVILALATTVLMAVPAFGGGRPLSADLSAANEVPLVVSPASGTAHVTLNQGQGEVCVDIVASGFVGTVFAGHIHRGADDEAGPVVVGLGVNDAIFSACVDGVDKDLIKDIRQNPQNFYVNVHSDFAPGGEIRGQLSK